MALKILLADDSMTAQNMGKKILVDAGYEVIPVSNGSAAIKKIAELKPDLVVLDIYMPGYSGLEVCERLKNAPETANMPVLLTVGKMEPYRPEDGAKVRADGVIIKPFEASDLIAAVAKLAEMVTPRTVRASANDEINDDEFQYLGDQPAGSEAAYAPDDPGVASALAAMMSGPAMMDEFSVGAPAFELPVAALPVYGFQEAQPIPVPGEKTSAMEAPAFWVAEAPAFSTEAEQVVDAPSYAFEAQDAPAFAMQPDPLTDTSDLDIRINETARTIDLESTAPVADEPVPLEEATSHELEFTSAPQGAEVEVVPESALETTPEDEPVVSHVQDPVWATTAEGFAAFATQVGETNPELMPVEMFGGIESMVPEGTLSARESVVSLEPVAFAEATVCEAPVISEEPVVEVAVPELHLLSEFNEAPVLEVAPAIAPMAWSAEETMVLPSESMALLEEEMQSFAQAEPLALGGEVWGDKARADEDILRPSFDEQFAEAEPEFAVEPESHQAPEFADVPELADRPSVESSAVAEPEALSVVPEDHDLEAAMSAALNEMEFDDFVAAPQAFLVAQPISSAMGDINVPIDATMQAQEPCMTQAPKAMAAAASFGSGKTVSVDASRIADVVQRVFERYKEQMVAEIARELSEKQ